MKKVKTTGWRIVLLIAFTAILIESFTFSVKVLMALAEKQTLVASLAGVYMLFVMVTPLALGVYTVGDLWISLDCWSRKWNGRR